MSEVHRMSVGLTAHVVTTAIIIVWGLASLMTAALAPDVLGSLPTVVSAGGLVLLGVVLLGSVARGSRLLYGILALIHIGLMVGSGAGTIRWTVPYDPSLAAVSMAAMNFVVAVALVYKTIQLVDVGIVSESE
jgi:hypothetical protein